MSRAGTKPITNRRRKIDRFVIALLVLALVVQTIDLIVQHSVPVVLVGWNLFLLLIGWYLYGAGKRAAALGR